MTQKTISEIVETVSEKINLQAIMTNHKKAKTV
jgi:hypothetical protein